ncbi:FkbM family methyltransferase [Leptolyngbya sp. FACHB-711]|uniref:FkbM family methyltransferase n=1 Tax=unclassified Leptolyngbya TaxID=2650499 RepID=UPI00168757B5|nr:FkbM family methyltransferase [Leptolyngbya sp. FACHB-711]MBD1849419.1 FkbM family methyltransferase [Cyanobacteria bacterium FACHB-502]MBD2024113.1 FkbM family methyltransferase [Leptolyngbya sp. FACHB-711]
MPIALTVVNQFITVENINDLFVQNGFEGEIDLLCIDIDGNDYHVWNAIESVSPRVVVIEYNDKFHPPVNWTIAYNPAHEWRGTDYFGASLKALEILGLKKGYRLVGSNLAGVNAFFVREDLVGDRFAAPFTAENDYHPPRYYLLPFYSQLGHQPDSGEWVEG